MNPQDQAYFDAIASKSVDSLVDTDIAYLRVRASYLSDEQREKFASILEEVKVEPAPKVAAKAKSKTKKK